MIIQETLRGAVQKLRRTPMPIADVSPMLTRAADKLDSQEKLLSQVVSYLADLNGSNWIMGDDAGSIDMRQRAKALQALVNNELRTKSTSSVETV